MNIQDSTVLVTGANRGIGKAFADALLDRGATKVYAAVRDVATVPGDEGGARPQQASVGSKTRSAGRTSPLGPATALSTSLDE